MNLLPKNKEEFSQIDYWDSFFKKRGNKAFEWYGEYPQLCTHLHKYVKPADTVLMVGCGNSTLGNDLYDVGYRNITSIDISKIAIRQMKNANETKRKEMIFLEMDATKMSFADDIFSVLIDKGTLDALMTDEDVKTIEKIDSYFDELLRVLKVGGRYVCISLLQEHILRKVLNYFPKNNCMLRVVRCYDAEKSAAEAGESALPVFVMVCTKFKSLPQKILEVNMGADDKMRRVADEREFTQIVSQAQQAAFVCSSLKRTTITDDDDISFELFNGPENIPRYTVYVTDITAEHKNMPYACFIVPQGRESEWLFSTKDGRKQLAVMSKCNRLAVVTLHRGQNYVSLDKVKEELADSVRNLAPSTIGANKIPYLSLGADVGERNIRHQGHSSFSGDYIVEDVVCDNSEYRRLYYTSSPLVIQSEAKLKEVKIKGKLKKVIDVTYLTCEHHIYMSRAVHMATVNKEKAAVAVIGLGGGGLCSFLRKWLPSISITAVDIDSDMLKIATEWFSLKTDSNLDVRIENGLDFLSKSSQDKKYSAILFDVDSKDLQAGLSCPPKEFLSNDVLQCVNNTLEHDGIFVLNLVLRNESLWKGIVNDISKHFNTIASYKLESDLNEVFICNKVTVPSGKLRKHFDESGKAINVFFREKKNQELISDVSGKDLLFVEENKKT